MRKSYSEVIAVTKETYRLAAYFNTQKAKIIKKRKYEQNIMKRIMKKKKSDEETERFFEKDFSDSIRADNIILSKKTGKITLLYKVLNFFIRNYKKKKKWKS